MNKTLIAVSIIFVFLFYGMMYSVWMIDISVGAIASNGFVTNGEIVQDPMIFYHQNLRNLIVFVISTFLLLEFLIVKKLP